MIVTYSLILVPSILFLINVSIPLGIAVTVITLLSLGVLLFLFSFTACSDPGIVWEDETKIPQDLEAAEMTERRTVTVECQQCLVHRPFSASHCYECELCVDNVSIFVNLYLTNVCLVRPSLSMDGKMHRRANNSKFLRLSLVPRVPHRVCRRRDNILDIHRELTLQL